MNFRDWLVTHEGLCEPRPSTRDWDLIREKYYFHQFLTDIIDAISDIPNEADQWDRLPQIRMRVRQLLMNSYWVRTRYLEPNVQTGMAVLTLYDEIGYPLTVQTETSAPGAVTSIHNHGTWGVVSVIQGQEEHTFWRRSPTPHNPDQIEMVGQRVFEPGEVVSFMPGAIHQVRAIAPEPTITFCLYGDTQPRSRFRFDPASHTAKHF